MPHKTPTQTNQPIATRLQSAQVKPSQLTDPVPGEEEADEFAEFFDEAPKDIQIAAAEELAPLEDEFAGLFDSGEVPQEAPPEKILGVELSPELSSFVTNVREGIETSRARLQASFGVTAEEQAIGAAQVLGKDNIRVEDGVVMRFSKKKGEFVPFDEDGLELIDDTLDFSRDFIEGVVENTVRLGGIFGGPAGVAIAGAGGAVIAKSVGDIIQTQVANIPIDPQRNLLLENSIAAAFGATFNLAASGLARRAATKISAKEAKNISIDNITKQVEETLEPIARLKQEEIIMSGELAKVLPGQAGADKIPAFKELAAKFKNEPQVIDFLDRQARATDEAFDLLTQKTRSLVNPEGKKFSAAEFRRKVIEGDNIQGALIGSFRKEAGAVLKEQKLPVDNTRQFIADLAEQLDGDFSSKNIQEVFSLADAGEAQLVTKLIEDAAEQTKGGMNFMKLRGSLNKLKVRLNNNAQKGGALYRLQAQLRSRFAADEVAAMDAALGNSQAFQEAKNSLFKLKDVQKKMKVVLNDDLNAGAFSRLIFEGSKNVGRVREIKQVAEIIEPGLWDQTVVNYLDSLKLRNATFKDGLEQGKVNWNAVSNTLGRLDPEVKKIIGETIPIQSINDIISMNQLIQNSKSLFKPGVNKNDLFSLMADLGKAATTRIGVANLFNRMASKVKDGAGVTLEQFMKEGGIEELLKSRKIKGLSPARKSAIRRMFDFSVRGILPAELRQQAAQATTPETPELRGL